MGLDVLPLPTTGGTSGVTSASLSALSARVATNSVQMTSADNAISNAISVVSQALSAEIVNRANGDSTLSSQIVANSAQMTSADNALSNAVSIVSQALSVETANRVAGDNTLSNAVSVLSANLSATASALSVRINTVSNALSALVLDSIANVSAGSPTDGQVLMWGSVQAAWVASTITGGSGSVTSTELSAVSAAAQSAINTVSNAVSIVSAQVVTNSAQMTSADNAISAAVVVVSALVSTVASALSVRINAVSNALSALILDSVKDVSAPAPTDQQVLTWNSVAAQWVASTITAGSGSVTSTELSAVSAAAQSAINTVSNAVSVVSQALSVETAARVANSAQMTSADNAISNAVSILSATLSTTASALSARINTVSNALSALVLDSIANVSAGSPADGNVLMWNSVAAQWIASAAGGAGSVTSTELSAVSAAAQSAINTVSNAVSIVSQSLSVETAARIAADNTLSANINTVSNAVSIVSQSLSVQAALVSNHTSAITTNSAQMTSADNAISNAVSIVSAAQAVTSAAVTSVNQVVSALSQRLSALVLDSIANVSAGSPVDGNVLMWNSVAAQWIASAAAGGAGSVTSTELSAVSLAAQSALSTETSARIAADNTLSGNINTVSNAVSIVSQALSVETANRVSAVNVVSQAVSVITAALGVTSKQYYGREFNAGSALASVVIDWNNGNVQYLSLTGNAIISAINPQAGARYLLNINTGSGAFSVTWISAPPVKWLTPDNAAPVLPLSANKIAVAAFQYNSALSAYIGSYGDDGPAAAVGGVSVTSTELSVVDARINSVQSVVSVLAAGFGTMQMKVVGDTQSISLSTNVNISGLSVSVAANAVYQIEAKIIYNVSAISATGYRIGMLASGLTQQNANGNWQGTSAQTVSTGGTAIALVNQPFNGLSGAFFSVVSAGTAARTYLILDALVVTSTTGGSLQLVGAVTIVNTSMYIYKGSYIRAYKIA